MLSISATSDTDVTRKFSTTRASLHSTTTKWSSTHWLSTTRHSRVGQLSNSSTSGRFTRKHQYQLQSILTTRSPSLRIGSGVTNLNRAVSLTGVLTGSVTILLLLVTLIALFACRRHRLRRITRQPKLLNFFPTIIDEMARELCKQDPVAMTRIRQHQSTLSARRVSRPDDDQRRRLNEGFWSVPDIPQICTAMIEPIRFEKIQHFNQLLTNSRRNNHRLPTSQSRSESDLTNISNPNNRATARILSNAGAYRTSAACGNLLNYYGHRVLVNSLPSSNRRFPVNDTTPVFRVAKHPDRIAMNTTFAGDILKRCHTNNNYATTRRHDVINDAADDAATLRHHDKVWKKNERKTTMSATSDSRENVLQRRNAFKFHDVTNPYDLNATTLTTSEFPAWGAHHKLRADTPAVKRRLKVNGRTVAIFPAAVPNLQFESKNENSRLSNCGVIAERNSNKNAIDYRGPIIVRPPRRTGHYVIRKGINSQNLTIRQREYMTLSTLADKHLGIGGTASREDRGSQVLPKYNKSAIVKRITVATDHCLSKNGENSSQSCLHSKNGSPYFTSTSSPDMSPITAGSKSANRNSELISSTTTTTPTAFVSTCISVTAQTVATSTVCTSTAFSTSTITTSANCTTTVSSTSSSMSPAALPRTACIKPQVPDALAGVDTFHWMESTQRNRHVPVLSLSQLSMNIRSCPDTPLSPRRIIMTSSAEDVTGGSSRPSDVTGSVSNAVSRTSLTGSSEDARLTDQSSSRDIRYSISGDYDDSLRRLPPMSATSSSTSDCDWLRAGHVGRRAGQMHCRNEEWCGEELVTAF